MAIHIALKLVLFLAICSSVLAQNGQPTQYTLPWWDASGKQKSNFWDFQGSGVIYVSTGTGSTDNRAGLSKYDKTRPFATVTAAGDAMTDGDTLMVSTGTHVLTKTLLLPSNSSLIGAGAGSTILRANFNTVSNLPSIIANTGFTAGAGYTGNSNITIRGFSISNATGNGISPAHVDGVHIEDVDVHDAIHFHLLDIVGCKNVVVRNVRQDLSTTIGSPDGGVIEVDVAQINAAGIWTGSSVVSVNADNTPCDTVLIESSNLQTTGASALWIHRPGNKNITFSNLYLRGGTQGIYSDTLTWENLIISDCVIFSDSDRAVFLRGATGTPAKNLLINNLIIIGTCNYRPIEINDVEGVVISNSTITYASSAVNGGGLVFALNTKYIVVDGCYIYNTVAPGSQVSSQRAIRMEGSGMQYLSINNTVLQSHITGISAQSDTDTSYTGVRFLNCTSNTTGAGFVPSFSSGQTVTGPVSVSSFINSGSNIQVTGVIQGGHTSATTYSRLGNATTTHSLNNANSLLITGLLEVDSHAFLDSNLTVTGTSVLNGTINEAPNQTLTGTSSVITQKLGDARYLSISGTTGLASLAGTNPFTGTNNFSGPLISGDSNAAAQLRVSPTQIVATGTSENGSIQIIPKGTGSVTITDSDGGTGYYLNVNGAGVTANGPAGDVMANFSNRLLYGAWTGSGNLTITGTTALNGNFVVDKTITPGGTTTTQTINKNSGSVNFPASGSSVTVINNRVSTSSVVHATVATDDIDMEGVVLTQFSGSFTLTAKPAPPMGEVRVNFLVTN